MATKKKIALHKHSHPAYAWIALIVSVFLILGVFGWYYLTYTSSLNDDIVLNVKNLSTNNKDTTSSLTTNPIDLVIETTAIDEELNTITDNNLSDTQLDDTILGIQ